ncbi:hypothetical protein [Cognatishimia activa]|uniref:hypothetical protein n=1 Tax=Cognatishimia activa TaxID=1715691 RepID=UPI002232C3F9|nr:hypothetical protein [Cognatishimia activa]UZD90444.1 hypothetical protein M0D42_12720 [Cognatishimia activa]
MNRWFLAASALTVVTLSVHVFAGGPEIHVPIQASELSEYLRAVSAVLWHAVSVVIAGFALAYLWAAKHDTPAMIWQMIAIQLGFAALFLWYGATLLGTIWQMPQWIIFLLIPLVSIVGLRRGSP